MTIKKLTVLTWFASCLISTSVAHAAEVFVLSNSSVDQHTRTLAASCAACHGTKGNSMGISPVLAGLDATYFATQMLAFKNGARASTVMHHHAKGLTTEEINHLAVYFSQQTRATSSSPKPQALKANHQ
jgi:cytochrome subunit of sulfide dehydrogenase